MGGRKSNAEGNSARSARNIIPIPKIFGESSGSSASARRPPAIRHNAEMPRDAEQPPANLLAGLIRPSTETQ